jgi:hypothetical protein
MVVSGERWNIPRCWIIHVGQDVIGLPLSSSAFPECACLFLLIKFPYTGRLSVVVPCWIIEGIDTFLLVQVRSGSLFRFLALREVSVRGNGVRFALRIFNVPDTCNWRLRCGCVTVIRVFKWLNKWNSGDWGGGGELRMEENKKERIKDE